MTATEAPRSRRRLWIGAGCAAVLVAGGIVAGVVLTSSDGNLRGEVSATLAAQHFVTALNSGNKDDAAAVACANFADQARSAATSGADPGIDFVLDSVAVDGTEFRDRRAHPAVARRRHDAAPAVPGASAAHRRPLAGLRPRLTLT